MRPDGSQSPFHSGSHAAWVKSRALMKVFCMSVLSAWKTSLCWHVLKPWLTLLLLAAVIVPPASGDEAAAENPAIQVQIDDMRLRSFSMLDSIRGQLEVRLTLTNTSSQDVVLEHNQFAFEFDGSSGAVNVAITDPLLVGRKTVPAGGKVTGWLGLHMQHASGNEPVMSLTLKLPDATVTTSLNQALRQSIVVKTQLMGPSDCLAVITLERAIDHLAVWLLNEEFVRLQKQGIQRVVVHAEKDEAQRKDPAHTAMTRSSSYQLAISAWLASASAATDPRRIPFRTQIRAPVQFRDFYAVDDADPNVRRYNGGIPNVYLPDREQAIAAALGRVFDNIGEAESLQALQHEEAGIRRAALQSGIDRLTASQLQRLLADSEQQSASQQALIAENLFRSPLPEAVNALERLVDSPTREISTAALKSLVHSPSPQAVRVLQRLWRTAQDQPDRQQQIVSAIIEANDFRHLQLLSDFAEQQLEKFSIVAAVATTTSDSSAKTEDANSDADAPPQDEDEDQVIERDSAASLSVQSPEGKLLQQVLEFLREQGQQAFEDVARRKLLNVVEPHIQDIVLEFVLGSDANDAPQLAQQYIQQRLPRQDSKSEAESESRVELTEEQRAELERRYAPRNGSSSSRITSQLMQTIRRYPDPAYTERLFQLSGSTAVSTTVRREAYQTALRCATEEQLVQIIDETDSEDRTRMTALLQHLSVMNHPASLDLARQALHGDDNMLMVSLSILRTSQSPEAMQIIVDRLDELRVEQEQLVAKGEKLDTQIQRRADRILDQLTSQSHSFIHPEAHRVINRLRRSPIPEFEALARQSSIRFITTLHPAIRTKLKTAYDLQKTGDYDQSQVLFEEIVANDPFYVLGHTALASLNLRAGRAEQAMQNLQQANRLSPEDTHTQSMIALTWIRLGQLQKGIDYAEEILTTVPDLPTTLRCDTLYNTACTYGRALEVQQDPKLRKTYTERGIELLQDCVKRERGFSDVNHVLADPDLNEFHNHPEWNNLLEQIRANEANKDNLKP